MFLREDFNELDSVQFSSWNCSHCFRFSLLIQWWVTAIHWFKVAFLAKSSKHFHREYLGISVIVVAAQKWAGGELKRQVASSGSGTSVPPASWLELPAGPQKTPIPWQVCPYRSKCLSPAANVPVIPASPACPVRQRSWHEQGSLGWVGHFMSCSLSSCHFLDPRPEISCVLCERGSLCHHCCRPGLHECTCMP